MASDDSVSINLDGVSMVYDIVPTKKVAVDSISLYIAQGTRLGIIGRNGAGKSTLLQMIAGLAAATSGTVRVTGHVTAVMTLGVGLREDLSGRENIYVDGEIQGRSRAQTDAVIEAIMAFADLGKFIDYPIRTYSTGMKARLAFAMITHVDPEILIIDEALSAGDARFASKASAKIREICSRGKIVIIVSHSMAAIRDMCNRCLWLDAGKVKLDGPPGEVCEAYLAAVRHDDEATLLAKFHRLVGSRSHQAGFELRWIELFDEDSASVRSVIECGRPVRIRCAGKVPASRRSADLRLQITRLDGLVVVDEQVTLNLPPESTTAGEFEAEARMHPLVLGPGHYKVVMRLLAGESEAAECSTVFEAFTHSPPIGGRAALLYPVTALSSPIQSAPSPRT